MTKEGVSLDLGDDYSEIREAVTKICDEYPGEYWRGLEDQGPEGSYPTAFVKALTAAGFLGALIPEEYGGSGGNFSDLAVLIEAMGCVCLPVPFFSTVVVSAATLEQSSASDLKTKLLPPLLEFGKY